MLVVVLAIKAVRRSSCSKDSKDSQTAVSRRQSATNQQPMTVEIAVNRSSAIAVCDGGITDASTDDISDMPTVRDE